MTEYTLQKPKIVLFDWDNTIVLTNGIFNQARSMLIPRLNLDPGIFETKAFKDVMHLSSKDKLPMFFGKDWEIVWQEYQKCYKEILDKNGGVIMFPGAEDFLKKLHNDNVLLGIVSNKSHDLLVNEVEMAGIKHLFTSIVGSGKALKDKPSEIHANHAIDEIISVHNSLTINAEKDCWFIGDSDVDISCAISAKCFQIIINSTEKAMLSKRYLMNNKIPHIHISSFEELSQKYNDIESK